MRKRALGLCMMVLLLFGAAATAEWDGYNEGALLHGDTNVYDAPDPLSICQGIMRPEHTFSITGSEPGWLRIQHDMNGRAQEGWIIATAADYYAALPLNVEIADLRRMTVACETLTLRQAPDTAARAVAWLPNGAHAYSLDEHVEGWLKVRCLEVRDGYHIQEGWIRLAFVVQDAQYITLLQEAQAHAYADKAAPLVGLLPKNTTLLVLGRIDGYWVVNLRGASAFIPDSVSVMTDQGTGGW